MSIPPIGSKILTSDSESKASWALSFRTQLFIHVPRDEPLYNGQPIAICAEQSQALTVHCSVACRTGVIFKRFKRGRQARCEERKIRRLKKRKNWIRLFCRLTVLRLQVHRLWGVLPMNARAPLRVAVYSVKLKIWLIPVFSIKQLFLWRMR